MSRPRQSQRLAAFKLAETADVAKDQRIKKWQTTILHCPK
jgi:hypothetical protein